MRALLIRYLARGRARAARPVLSRPEKHSCFSVIEGVAIVVASYAAFFAVVRWWLS